MSRRAVVTMLVAACILIAGAQVWAKGAISVVALTRALADSIYVELAGDTMTGTLTFSAVTTDITAASTENVRIVGGATSGSVQLLSPDEAVEVLDAAGNVDFTITTEAAGGTRTVLSGPSAGAGVGIAGGAAGAVAAGSTASQVPGTEVLRIAEGISTAGSTGLMSFYGGGAYGVTTQQAITIADNAVPASAPTDTTSPTSSQVEVTCSDVDGCNYNPGETSVVDGWQIAICNISTANVVTINETAGTIRVQGAATTIVLNTMECADAAYSGTEWGAL